VDTHSPLSAAPRSGAFISATGFCLIFSCDGHFSVQRPSRAFSPPKEKISLSAVLVFPSFKAFDFLTRFARRLAGSWRPAIFYTCPRVMILVFGHQLHFRKSLPSLDIVFFERGELPPFFSPTSGPILPDLKIVFVRIKCHNAAVNHSPLCFPLFLSTDATS